MNPESLLRTPFVVWLALSFASAFLVMALIGRPMIARLKSLKGMKWSAREDTPDTHAAKAGTPSMGGVGIMLAATLAYVGVICTTFAAVASSPKGVGPNGIPTHIWISLALLPAMTLLHMALGLADDWSKATGRGGLRARAKLLGQLILATGFLVCVYLLTVSQPNSGPHFFGRGRSSDFAFDLANPLVLLLMFAFLMIVLVGTCNAVNITDGIDGLAAGLCVQVGFAFCLIGTISSNDINGVSNLWWLALAGACAGFLIFNKHKAQVFMGDTGSLALGAALGAAAVMTRTVFLIPFVGFLFFVELLSVTTQVAYFKYTKKQTGEGKRIFKRAPLHHHFELSGWSEKKVVLVFWSVNLVATAIGLLLWRAGILPRFP